MRWLRVVILTLIASVLQVSLLGALRIGGVVPNLVLVLVVGLVIWGTLSEALLAAIVAGLLMDVSGSGVFGLAVSSLVVIALGLVALRQLGLDGQAWSTRMVLIVVATLVWWLIHVVAISLASLLLLSSWRILVLECVCNCLLGLVVTERLIRGTRTI